MISPRLSRPSNGISWFLLRPSEHLVFKRISQHVRQSSERTRRTRAHNILLAGDYFTKPFFHCTAVSCAWLLCALPALSSPGIAQRRLFLSLISLSVPFTVLGMPSACLAQGRGRGQGTRGETCWLKSSVILTALKREKYIKITYKPVGFPLIKNRADF